MAICRWTTPEMPCLTSPILHDGCFALSSPDSAWILGAGKTGNFRGKLSGKRTARHTRKGRSTWGWSGSAAENGHLQKLPHAIAGGYWTLPCEQPDVPPT